MKFYQVVQKYFDNGIVQANSFIVHADTMPESTCEELDKCDVYKDYFKTPEEAEEYRQQALNA